jgi:hypothetical protein
VIACTMKTVQLFFTSIAPERREPDAELLWRNAPHFNTGSFLTVSSFILERFWGSGVQHSSFA